MHPDNFELIDRFISHGAVETAHYGRSLAGDLQPGAVLTFTGDLGSGKTTLIQGICQGLGVTEVVSSPTFTLINEYRGRLPVYHFDFYRMGSPGDLHDLGVTEYLYGEGVCLIEWPELIAAWLPPGHIRFALAHGFAVKDKIKQWDKSHPLQSIVDADIRIIEVYQRAATGH